MDKSNTHYFLKYFGGGDFGHFDLPPVGTVKYIRKMYMYFNS